MRLSKAMRGAVSFAHFCTNQKLSPADVAQLIAHASASKRAWERMNNGGRGALDSDFHAEAVEQLAHSMGFEVDWPGLWPVLRRDGHDVYLPTIE